VVSACTRKGAGKNEKVSCIQSAGAKSQLAVMMPSGLNPEMPGVRPFPIKSSQKPGRARLPTGPGTKTCAASPMGRESLRRLCVWATHDRHRSRFLNSLAASFAAHEVNGSFCACSCLG
jgi:hypothetical protein